MQVKVLKTAIGQGWRIFEGQQLDIPDEVFARRLVDCGFVSPVEPEAAAYQPRENAARFKPSKHRR